MEEKRSKKAFQVIDGGKAPVQGDEGGPAFGSGMKAEEARGLRQPLTPEEIDELHNSETPPGSPETMTK